MDTKKTKILLGLATVFILITGYFIYQFFMFAETDNAQVEAPTVMLAARISGYIKAVKVVEGQKVKKGDVLLELDNRDYQAAYDSAKSELLSVEARKKDAEKSFHRAKDLFAQGAVSPQQYDTATANFNEVKARYDAASSRLVQSQLNLENTSIRAPANGSIARKSAEEGQLASPGVPLLGFVSGESRWVTANYKETDISNIRIGQKVDLHIDALPEGKFLGEVESISSATGATFTLLPPDNATGNFTKVVQRVPIKIKFVNLAEKDRDRIQAGLSVISKIHIR